MEYKVVDVDWKFGVTAASSEKNQVGKTFLQMKITVDSGNGLKNIHMEMSLPQFYAFLHELEKAATSLQYAAVN